MPKESFFSLAAIKEPVNQWICIAFMGVLCFWVVIYYLNNRIQTIGENYNKASLSGLQALPPR